MIFSRGHLFAGFAGCLLACRPLPAQEPSLPVVFDQQFSADMAITGEGGLTMTQRIFTDNGKVRVEAQAAGTSVIMILRPGEGKVYSVLPAQKMIMAMPFDADKLDAQMAFATGLDRKYDNLGPEVVEGIACTKYRFTSADKKVYDLWVDTVRKIPVMMAARDHSFSMLFTHYQPGPQDPSLFELPPGYQTVDLPSLPQMPTAPARP